MRPRGFAEIQKAKEDGRWERAYQGQATAQVPPDLQEALDRSPVAAKNFAALKSQPRYHILHQLMIARTEKTRTARLARFVAELERGPEG
ncbi:YdeI family protein [Glutamicibacter sp. NPDC087673]|uniref:YdeI/OmpD-associated family protein n=1 Tax=Glutamicibacter sp. NPDC087673 TaxID=3363997 RepID=UPI0037F96286